MASAPEADLIKKTWPRDVCAAGATLSGAGPCLIAYVLERRHAEEAVGKAMLEAFREHDVEARILTLDLDTHGAQILK